MKGVNQQIYWEGIKGYKGRNKKYTIPIQDHTKDQNISLLNKNIYKIIKGKRNSDTIQLMENIINWTK